MNMGRTLLLSPTASGKSLIIYALIRYYLDLIPKDKNSCCCTHDKFVEQMYSDFKDYSKINGWDVFRTVTVLCPVRINTRQEESNHLNMAKHLQDATGILRSVRCGNR